MEKLRDINGQPSDFNISSLKKISDLVYYDGPLISHFMNDKNENYIFYWIDVDENYNRWLVFKIEPSDLEDYLKSNLLLIDIIEKTNLYCVDIDNDINYHNVKLISISEFHSFYE